MFRRIRGFELIDKAGRWYRPRVYGDPLADGTWDGWLVFFPIGGGPAIASGRETTQSSVAALATWAEGLTPVYIDGALDRALRLARQSDVVTRLEDAEYEALEDAEQLETAAEIERVAAEVDEIAAAQARTDADEFHRARLATEGAIAATQEHIASKAAEVHEEAARSARALAREAARRSRESKATASGAPPQKKRRSETKRKK